jgi:hypothetical protein
MLSSTPTNFGYIGYVTNMKSPLGFIGASKQNFERIPVPATKDGGDITVFIS